MDAYTAERVDMWFDTAMFGIDRETVTEWLDDHTHDVPAFVWYAVRALEECADK